MAKSINFTWLSKHEPWLAGVGGKRKTRKGAWEGKTSRRLIGCLPNDAIVIEIIGKSERKQITLQLFEKCANVPCNTFKPFK